MTTQISPSSTSSPVSGSTSTMSTPGQGRPIDPGRTAWPGELHTSAVVSVCPYPSRMVTPQSFSTRAMTSGFSGSPAPRASRGTRDMPVMSAWMSMRHTVGGAQNVSTPHRSSCPISAPASKRSVL